MAISTSNKLSARSSRSAFDYSTAKDEAELLDKFNGLAEHLSFLNKSLSIQSNFDGFIAENVTIEAGETKKIEHFLGVLPKWRIILKQIGNGVLTDVPSEWSDKVISLKNNGAESVIFSVFIARE